MYESMMLVCTFELDQSSRQGKVAAAIIYSLYDLKSRNHGCGTVKKLGTIATLVVGYAFFGDL